MLYLKQSTASQSVLIGPFVDSTDGATAETGLTIANTDIRLSANGGNLAAKNSGGGTHDEAGWYTITLDATDTATVGRLQLHCKMTGALMVHHEFWVLEEAIYDALFGASATGFDANGRVDVAAIAGTAQTARDIGASVLLSPGTGTGQISLTSGAVTAGTVSDKTGYSLTATTGLGNQTANITGNLSGSVGSVTGAVGSVTGAVGSVTGNVGGNVVGSVASVTGAINTAAGTITTLDGLDTAQDSQHSTTQAAILDAAGIRTAVGLASANLDTQLGALPTAAENAAAALTTQMTESYAANGTAPTLTEAMMAVHQMLMDFSISGTSLTVEQLDGTTAFVVTLDSASAPTSANRA